MGQFDGAHETVKFYHHLLSLPLKLLTALKIGPFGGENSISAAVEAVIMIKKGEDVTFPLSKTEQSFVKMLVANDLPDAIMEYRELSYTVQREILKRWGTQKLGVVWIGAGVFSLENPLIAERKPRDWHVWTDASPRVVANAESAFEEIKTRGDSVGMVYSIMLPQDVEILNRTLALIAPDVEHIIIYSYGMTYALTLEENAQWLSRLNMPDVDVSFVFNSPGKHIQLLPGVIAAFYRQSMYYFETQHIDTLFKASFPNSEIVWEMSREQTRNNTWGTWLIHVPRS